MSSVWIIDDDANLLKVLAVTLREGGHEPTIFTAPESLLTELETGSPDVLISDLMMPRYDGIEILRIAKRRAPEIPVILLTAHGSIDRAVEAMKAGAYDFLTKPVESEKLLVTMRNATEFGTLSKDVRRLRERRSVDLRATVVGQSPAINQVREMISRVAAQNATVLISGETGSGKEVVARAVHASSARAAGPFVPVNCGAIPHDLIESELFGHSRGAFTGAVRDRKGWFEAADGGTLFLDEVGELPPPAQTKLLRALQERLVTPLGDREAISVDVRIIAASNRDLAAEVKEGRFREDLFYRLNVFPIVVPPLRERREDIPLLVAHLLKQRTDDAPELYPEALAVLGAYDWPGNVRELENVLERALVLSEEKTIKKEHIAIGGKGTALAGVTLDIPESGIELDMLEMELIRQALAKTDGNQSRAARLLGITRSALIYRMEKHGLLK